MSSHTGKAAVPAASCKALQRLDGQKSRCRVGDLKKRRGHSEEERT